MPDMEGGGGWNDFDDYVHTYDESPKKEECVQLELDDFNNYNPLNNYKKLYQDAWRNEKTIRAEWLREGEEIPVSVMDDSYIRELLTQTGSGFENAIVIMSEEETERRIRDNIRKHREKNKKGFIASIFGR